MRRLCVAILGFSLTLAAQDGKPNFSGAWEMDAAKSDFGVVPGPQSIAQVVDHKDPKLKWTTTAVTPRGEQVTEFNLTTDGEECTNEVRGAVAKSKTRWVERDLATDIQIEAQGMKFQIQDRWQISEDGKTFTINRTMKSDQGEIVQKIVFARKAG
jgi:hypothetical protein